MDQSKVYFLQFQKTAYICSIQALADPKIATAKEYYK